MSANTWQLQGVQGDPAITDPGAAGVIDTGGRFITSLVITVSGASTRTVTKPDVAGQLLFICSDNGGDDVDITFTPSLNAAGNTVAAFDDADDCLTLVSVNDGDALRWQITSNVGSVALS